MTSISKTFPSVNFPDRQEQLPGELYLSTIGDTFDKTRDIALGPYCFLGREDVLPDWWNYPFIDPFPVGEPAIKAQINIAALISRILPGMVDKLNAYHGTSYPQDFWRLLVFPWLMVIIQRAWMSYTTLQKIKDRVGGRRLSVKVLLDPPLNRYTDTEHFFNSLLKDYNFNWWIDSKIASAMAPDDWVFVPSKPLSHAFQVTESKSIRKPISRLRRGLRTIKYWLGYGDIVGIRWSGLLLALYANLLPKRPARKHSEPPMEFHPESYFPDNFLDIVDRLCDITMPRSMLDGFEKLAANARKLHYKAGRFRIGALDQYNDQEKVNAAFAREAREKLVHCQHGGRYGFDKYDLASYEYDFKSEIFISWGWTLDEPIDCHILPLPGPYLSKIANCHRRRNDSVIVVGNPIRLRIGQIQDAPTGAVWLRYCEHTIDLLKTLSDDVLGAAIFRPYLKSASDIDIGRIVNDHFPEMPMLEGDLHAAMTNCRLLILGSPSTTLNLSMAANIPTIVYWHEDFLNLRDEAVPYFDAIKRAGILFSDAEDAARHVNRIWDDVEGWWNSRDVQDARKFWADQYARTDRFWWWQWIKALTRLKNVG